MFQNHGSDRTLGRFFLVLCVTCAIMSSCNLKRNFSETAWKADQSVRFLMIDSLIMKLNREKPSEKQVEELLGPKMDLDDFQENFRSYFLKSDALIVGMDASYLDIEFDDGSFKSATIGHQD